MSRPACVCLCPQHASDRGVVCTGKGTCRVYILGSTLPDRLGISRPVVSVMMCEPCTTWRVERTRQVVRVDYP